MSLMLPTFPVPVLDYRYRDHIFGLWGKKVLSGHGPNLELSHVAAGPHGGPASGKGTIRDRGFATGKRDSSHASHGSVWQLGSSQN